MKRELEDRKLKLDEVEQVIRETSERIKQHMFQLDELKKQF
jgi:hypothetical protein